MTSTELAKKAVNVANNYKTCYIWGGFGAPITKATIQRAENQYSKNTTKGYAAAALKLAGQSNAFYFDCVGLIKALLWGWVGDSSKSYGGATYASNGVPDITADQMISKCSGVSTDFSNIQVGEALWCSGHIGIYIGNGLGVECTPSWNNGVQITAVGNIGKKSGYNTRKWTKHGKLPYVTYSGSTASAATQSATAAKKENKVALAQKFDKTAAKGVQYEVTASWLNVRTSASSANDENIIKSIPKGTKVMWYGYYTNLFYLVQLPDKTEGYVHSYYLRRKY